MTSEQIKSATEDSKNPAGWLKEIAYQSAMLNERLVIVYALLTESITKLNPQPHPISEAPKKKK